MIGELLQLSFDKIMQTKSYTVIILGAGDKRFGIYTDSSVGKILQQHLTEAEKPRPLTHDLFRSIFVGYGMRVKQVVINDVQGTVYYARLFLEQDLGDVMHILEVDARPSDAITIALIGNAPVYCTHQVLEKVVPFED